MCLIYTTFYKSYIGISFLTIYSSSGTDDIYDNFYIKFDF